MSAALHPLLAENSLFHLVGRIFHPVFVAVSYVLAAIYSVIPNYAVAITLLTLLIMALLTPLTVKSTKSMLAMQEIQPEIKKLQQKYKGAENRAQLNEEMMRLYRERGVNPAGSCLPMFLQMPFLIVLYDVLRGLVNTVTVHGHLVPQPRYIPTTSRMYQDLVHSVPVGSMNAFGMNLALKPFSPQPHWYAHIPYFVLVAVAVVLQYVQMSQMNKRNSAAAQANKQMQTMQKVMPIFFAYIYFVIPAAVVIYMVVSTLVRIVTQDVIFRTGIVRPAGEREIAGGGALSRRSKGIISAASSLVEERRKGVPAETPAPKAPEAPERAERPGTAAKGGGGGRSPGGTARPNGRGKPSAGSTSGSTAAKGHPRSKGKRARRTR